MSASSQKRTFLDTATNGNFSMILLLLDVMERPGTMTYDDMTRQSPDMKFTLDRKRQLKTFREAE